MFWYEIKKRHAGAYLVDLLYHGGIHKTLYMVVFIKHYGGGIYKVILSKFYFNININKSKSVCGSSITCSWYFLYNIG